MKHSFTHSLELSFWKPMLLVGILVGASAGRARAQAPDDAVVTAVDLPSTLRCGQTYQVSVTMQNSGSSTWTEADEYRLGAVGDSDDLNGPGRVLLPDGLSIVSGDSYNFVFNLKAPSEPRTYVTDWQMVHERVAWFGGTAASQVTVTCEPAQLESIDPIVIQGNKFFAGGKELKLIGGRICREVRETVGPSSRRITSTNFASTSSTTFTSAPVLSSERKCRGARRTTASCRFSRATNGATASMTSRSSSWPSLAIFAPR